jgi:hypothetical protein
MSEDYKGSHEAPSPEFGAPMHDVTANGMYPKDFYANPHHYVSSGGETGAHQSLSAVQFAQNRPRQLVTVYRAVPKSAPRGGINPGDLVTPSRQYALEHGRSNLNGEFKIRSTSARAAHLWNDANSINEWGYHPNVELPPRNTPPKE